MTSYNTSLQLLTTILVSLFLWFYICFPQIRIGSTAIYTLIVYLLTIIAAYLHFFDKKNILCKKSVKAATRIFFRFVILSLIGYILAILFSRNASFAISTFLSQNLILIIYAFTFSTLCQYSKICTAMTNVIILSACMVGFYGLFCYVTETNPYITFVTLKYGDNGIVGGGEIGSAVRGLSHRVSGNIGNPVYFAGELLLLLGICFISSKSTILNRLKLKTVAIILMLIALIFTGSRSSMIPLFLFLAFYVYRKYKLKAFLLVLFWGVLLYALIPFISSYLDIETFISLGMRYSQFSGLLDIVGENVLWGNGVGWVADYVAKWGRHPVLEGFESIVFSSFVDGGLWGLVVVYPILFMDLSKYIKRYSPTDKIYYSQIYLLMFIAFSILTGMYGIKMFIVFLMLAVNTPQILNHKKVDLYI